MQFYSCGIFFYLDLGINFLSSWIFFFFQWFGSSMCSNWSWFCFLGFFCALAHWWTLEGGGEAQVNGITSRKQSIAWDLFQFLHYFLFFTVLYMYLKLKLFAESRNQENQWWEEGLHGSPVCCWSHSSKSSCCSEGWWHASNWSHSCTFGSWA